MHDPRRNHLEYLTIPHRRWNRWFNHPLKHQNRLRASQFHALFSDCGFDCRREDRIVDEESLSLVECPTLDEEFRKLSQRDLATIGMEVILQKPHRSRSQRHRYCAEPQDSTHDLC